jgi:hypothetical protein
MPDFLADPTTTMYVVLGAMVAILGVLALRRQKRSDVITFVIGVVLLAALFLIDRSYDSPRELVVKKLDQMETASKANDYDEVFKHISDQFQYKSLNKKALRDRADIARSYFPEGVELWNYDARRDFKEMVDGSVEQEFDVQPVGQPQFRHRCVGVFKKEADGEWRLVTFRLYPVVGGAEGGRQEVTPPGL